MSRSDLAWLGSGWLGTARWRHRSDRPRYNIIISQHAGTKVQFHSYVNKLHVHYKSHFIDNGMEHKNVIHLGCVTKTNTDVSCKISAWARGSLPIEAVKFTWSRHMTYFLHYASVDTACCPQPSVPCFELLLQLQYRFQCGAEPAVTHMLLGSNLGWDTDYPDLQCSWVSSVLPGKFQDNLN
jgi:hypothetical protein